MAETEPPWSYSLPDEGKAFAPDFVELVWSWMTTDTLGRIDRRNLHSKDILEKLVNEAFSASLQSEEARPVHLQLLFGHIPKQVTVTFDDPLLYTAGNLVKLAPTIGIGFRWVVVAPEPSGHNALNIIGICDPELSPAANAPMRAWGGGLSSHQPNPLGTKLSVFGPGWIRIQTTGGSFFELRNCCIRIPFSVAYIKEVKEWYEEAADCFDFSQLPGDKVVGEVVGWAERRRRDAQELVRRTWGSILSKVCNAQHGGTFLVIPKSADISNLVKFKYQMQTDQLKAAIWKRATFEPGLSNQLYRRSMAASELDEAHFAERDLGRTADLAASFSSVDGAVVLQRDCTLLGFGGEILDTQIPSESEMIKYGKHPLGQPKDRPLINFGMRHRSAYRFCQKIERSLAFVVSQDGDLRVFYNSGGIVNLFEGPTTEDWVYTKFTSAETHKDQ